MINGEGWLDNGVQAELSVIPCLHYTHDSYYELPVAPSPNLPNIRSILLYPSLCLFEGTTVSVGRGTTSQFQIYGHPEMDANYEFTTQSRAGAKYPKHENKLSYGVDLSEHDVNSIKSRPVLDFSYLLSAYQNLNDQGVAFFNDNNFFEKLAGTKDLRSQIKAGLSEQEIRATWTEGLDDFKVLRKEYLIY